MISIIVAIDRENGIGQTGGMLWHLPADFAYFKKVTSGHPIIMGRKTFDSIGRALPKRTNIVVTRNANWKAQDVLVAPSLVDAVGMAYFSEGSDEVFIIGGGEIYKEAMGLADKLYVTEVDTEVKTAEVFFPKIDKSIWQEISRDYHVKDPKNGYDYSFVVYNKRQYHGGQK